MALMNLTIIPLGTGSPSVGDHIVRVVEFLKGRGVTFQVCDMGTVLEGEPNDLFPLITEINELLFNQGLERIVCQITLDVRRDKKISIGDKVNAVLQKID